MGLEPTIFRFEVGRLIRWATRPYLYCESRMINYQRQYLHSEQSEYNQRSNESRFVRKINKMNSNKSK